MWIFEKFSFDVFSLTGLNLITEKSQYFGWYLQALSKTLTEDELVYLRAQFMLLEPNKNGRVTFENFKTVGTLDFLYFLFLFFLRTCSCYYACRIKVLLVLPSCFSNWVVQSQCQKFDRIGLLPLSKTLIGISCLQITKQPVSCYFDLLSRFIICLLVFGWAGFAQECNRGHEGISCFWDFVHGMYVRNNKFQIFVNLFAWLIKVY